MNDANIKQWDASITYKLVVKSAANASITVKMKDFCNMSSAGCRTSLVKFKSNASELTNQQETNSITTRERRIRFIEESLVNSKLNYCTKKKKGGAELYVTLNSRWLKCINKNSNRIFGDCYNVILMQLTHECLINTIASGKGGVKASCIESRMGEL